MPDLAISDSRRKTQYDLFYTNNGSEIVIRYLGSVGTKNKKVPLNSFLSKLVSNIKASENFILEIEQG